MAKVTGIGGVFIKARDPVALAGWYREHLGLPIEPWNGAMIPHDGSANAYAIWSAFPADTAYFGAGPQQVMINFRVDDLDALVAALRASGADVDPKVADEPYGRFAWVTDPEGNRVELWQPSS